MSKICQSGYKFVTPLLDLHQYHYFWTHGYFLLIFMMRSCLSLPVSYMYNVSVFSSAIASWLGSPDRNCAGCYVITWECFGIKKGNLGAETKVSFEVSHMQFCGGWEHQRVRRSRTAIASHYKSHIWPHAVLDHKLYMLCSVCDHDNTIVSLLLWKLIMGSHFWSEPVKESDTTSEKK